MSKNTFIINIFDTNFSHEYVEVKLSSNEQKTYSEVIHIECLGDCACMIMNIFPSRCRSQMGEDDNE